MTAPTTDYYYCVIIRSGTSFTQRINGSVPTGGSTTATIGATTVTGMNMLFTAGNLFFNNGYLAEFGICNSALAGSDLTNLEAYLAAQKKNLISLSLTSPSAYQVFQRSGSVGTLTISGRMAGKHDLEASFCGGAYETILLAAAVNNDGTFSTTWTNQAQGQGSLVVRLKDAPGTSVTVQYVGIRDVLVIAGQSNAGGRGTNNQSYSHATRKAGLFGNDYLWKQLADPTDSPTNQVDTVSLDVDAAGSVWPLVATYYLANQDGPVAFVPCAKGESSIAWLPGANHQDRATLYGSMVYRALQTGCKCVLWHQGEGDVVDGTSQADYNARLDTIANAVNADLGVKLMVCKLQDMSTYLTGYDVSAINAAIEEAWNDNANVLAGPDFSDITPSVDGLHFKTDAELSTAAARWWAALQAAFGW